ncbi:hypothetical protein [Aquabacterium sp. NJ1]|uniref:hypothetical protein n=1 Tax=Aquabacterium sp. NJ1 TaxID=1538295 RepID=UPI000A945497|nr:hypothetical protein [Aquabacterium sp. NJ1]
MSTWFSNNPSFTEALPRLDFPFESLPDLYLPERTIFTLPDRSRLFPYMWCYLRRRTTIARKTEYDPSSLSKSRTAAMPAVITRLSNLARNNGWRPRTIHSKFEQFSAFLLWVDSPEQGGKFEKVLSDKEIGLAALKAYHTYLRHRVQTNQLGATSGGTLDKSAIALLSELHDYVYLDKIEPLQTPALESTAAPLEKDVAEFTSTLQAIFDSAAAIVLDKPARKNSKPNHTRTIRLSASNDNKITTLPDDFPIGRLMDLACVTFTGLVIADSGANQGVITSYEEPDDLLEQLGAPERINLTHKAIKFRAGGKIVPVHLTATTVTRLRTYLAVRDRFISFLNTEDVQPLFIQGKWETARNHKQNPLSVQPIQRGFLDKLRNKVRSVQGELPKITLRQLRLHKQQYVTRRSGPEIAAKVMGTTVATAVRHYSKSEPSVQRNEMSSFLDQLSKKVIDGSSGQETTAIPAGSCLEHGRYQTEEGTPPLKPDCKKPEGCFFCNQFCVHADETDMRKLFSCKYVLQHLSPLQGDSKSADRTYHAILNRIDTLLSEIRRRIPNLYSAVEQDVKVDGNLTAYWAIKLQQLHLLGMLTMSS